MTSSRRLRASGLPKKELRRQIPYGLMPRLRAMLKWGSVSLTSVPVSVFSIPFLYNYAFPLSQQSMLNQDHHQIIPIFNTPLKRAIARQHQHRGPFYAPRQIRATTSHSARSPPPRQPRVSPDNQPSQGDRLYTGRSIADEHELVGSALDIDSFDKGERQQQELEQEDEAPLK
jgi:hypothetical protein